MARAAVRAIEYHLPSIVVSTESLAAQFPEWSIEKIDEKVGISERHYAAPDECSSDLAEAAVRKLFESGVCRPEDIDFLLLCTQTPDYFLPTTACLLQDRLSLPKKCGALDFNLSCSGYVYGLGLAQGLIESGQARNLLLVTAETYSKFLHPKDRSVRAIFGDAAAATLVSATDREDALLGPYVYGTDGSGGPNLMVPAGGMRVPRSAESAVEHHDEHGNVRTKEHLFMNGPEVFNLALSVVPETVCELLARSGKTMEEIDLFVLHQANRYMLQHLRKKMRIPEEKFYIVMSHCGNTVSSTIPIALKHAEMEGKLKDGALVMLVGYGAGYSWGATLLRWTEF
jgi:3-oxoacyl-[acyl-carrier-protein] synthase III